jgi:hypothetical protein
VLDQVQNESEFLIIIEKKITYRGNYSQRFEHWLRLSQSCVMFTYRVCSIISRLKRILRVNKTN